MLKFLTQTRKKFIRIKKKGDGVKILRKQFLKKLKKQDAVFLSLFLSFLSEYLIFSVEDNKEIFLRGISMQYSFSLLRYLFFYLISR